MKYILLEIWLVLFIASLCSASIIHVPGDYYFIQEAIDAAANGDTVLIADGTYTGYQNRDIQLQGKAITVTSQNGAATCVIDCEANYYYQHRAFEIYHGEGNDTVIQGLTIRNGYTVWGSGIRCPSSPTIRDCVFEYNYATARGAGIEILGSPQIINCIFINNESEYEGAGIYCRGFEETPFISNCRFENNVAGTYGGGVCIYQNFPEISDCVFSGNKALSGGAIACQGYSDQPVIKRCDFLGNYARLLGGGISVFAWSQPVIGCAEDDGNYFEGNYAAGGADIGTEMTIFATYNTFAGYCYSDYYVSPQNYVNLTGCISLMTPITQQEVYVSPDGNDNNDGLTWNTALRSITEACRRVHAYDLNPIDINVAPGDYSESVSGDYYPIPLIPHVAIVGSQTEDVILNAEQATYAVYGFHDTVSILMNLTVSGGYWEHYGAGLYGTSIALVIDNCVVKDNISGYCGAGIYLYNSSLMLTDSVITNNTSDAYGGGLYVDIGDLDISSSIFSHNAAGAVGGGIYDDATQMDIAECVFLGNTASYNGGGMYSSGNNTLINRCSFSANSAADFGGGLDMDANVFLTRSNFEENSARSGGAVNCDSYDVLITDCSFRDNHAEENGGGLYQSFYSYDSIIDNTLFAENSSGFNGGGIWSEFTDMHIGSCTIAFNTAGQNGGGMYIMEDSQSDVTNSIFWGNTAPTGSQIWLGSMDDPSSIDIDYSVIHDGLTGIHSEPGCFVFLGDGVLIGDPAFVSGSLGDYFLSQIAAGQPADSICRDNGSDLAEDICFDSASGTACLNYYTTRVDLVQDNGVVDIGYHYRPWDPTPTPTPIPSVTMTATPTESSYTFTATPVATSTPTPSPFTPTPGCGELGVTLWMPSHDFYPGDMCGCHVIICNPGNNSHYGIPLFVILDVYCALFFAPSYNNFDYYRINVRPGQEIMEILPLFPWPEGAGEAGNIHWYAGMTDTAMRTLLGEMDFWTFGWHF